GGGMHEWMPVDEPNVLWLNTALLVVASIAMQVSRGAIGRGNVAAARQTFAAAGLLSIGFLAGQAWAWQSLASSGLYTVQTPAYTFFILLTAVHGLHLGGGLFVLIRAAQRLWRTDPRDVATVERLGTSVQLCTTYWHFLLIVWIGLFW